MFLDIQASYFKISENQYFSINILVPMRTENNENYCEIVLIGYTHVGHRWNYGNGFSHHK